MYSVLAELIDLAASTLYKLIRYDISFDKAFKASISKRIKMGYVKLYYDLVRKFVSNFMKPLLLYIKRIAAEELENLSDDLICRFLYRAKLKELVRIWLCLEGDSYIISKELRDRVAKVCRDRNLRKEDLLHDLYIVLDLLDPIRRLAVKYSYPIWFVTELQRIHMLEDIEKLLFAMEEETIWIRVNTLRIDYDKALKLLEAEGIEYEVDKDLWYMLKLIKSSRPIHETEAFKKGFVITQDKASAFVVEVLKPEPGDVVLDLCSAPGVKLSQIFQLVEGNVRVVAVDISKQRLLEEIGLLRLLGVDMDRIDFIVADASFLHLRGRFDKVLIDAPCSNSGAVMKDPATKIRLLLRSNVAELSELQKKILRNAINFGEVLIYATCSLLPKEGEEVVLDLITNAPTSIDYINERLVPSYVGGRYLGSRTFPHIHETQGFFIARILRR